MSIEITKENEQLFSNLFSKYSSYNSPIKTNGENTEFSDAIDINYSDILSRLIQEAGRYCEHYASDLFITWSRIDQSLRDGSIESGVEMFGFREMGVDHTGFIFSRAENNHRTFEYEYRSIWKLEIEVEVDEHYWWHKAKKNVKMTLYRVHAVQDYRYEKFFYDLKEQEKNND